MIRVYYFVSQLLLYSLLFFVNCGGAVAPSSENPKTEEGNMIQLPSSIKYLALGDSYTIGHSVCEKCRFPEQLASSLREQKIEVALDIVARTGWTTGDLLNAINSNISKDYDLVTLLIGVNNQYRREKFKVFEKDFITLLDDAIRFAKGDYRKVVVVSIPDYAYTKFGGGDEGISKEIKEYNSYSEKICKEREIAYVYITDITQRGLSDPSLVADDSLHPSRKAYAQFVERLLPVVTEALNISE